MNCHIVVSALCVLVLSLTVCSAFGDEGPSAWGQWQKWGDQRDGTYRNPVIPSDYSDIDCIRVDTDYYAISSTFQFSPGVVILHSKDLVNWSILGHAVNDLTQISPALGYKQMDRYGKGIWAGAIRYHDHKFWIYFGTPDEGYFMTTASNPAGPWAPLHQVLAEPGWDDCCPLFDDDGQAYLVGSHFSDGYKIHMWKLTPDCRDILPSTDTVIHQSSGSEANKLYKINGYYYHLYSENKNGRYVMMERCRSIFGPYNESKQLNYPDTQFREPNQGGLVQTANGGWYFFTHHGTGDWEGRCDSLVPVTWIDGWPIIGQPDANNIGHFVWSGRMPILGFKTVAPQTDDEFNEAALPAQWEWNYQPRSDMWSLDQRPGWLRLHAFMPIDGDNFFHAGNTLTQRCLRTVSNEVTIKVSVSGMADGQKAGLCHFARGYSLFGVVQRGTVRYLEFVDHGATMSGPVLTGTDLWLRSTWGLDGVSQYAYSLDGKKYVNFGTPCQLTWGSYRGDRIGIYSFNPKSESGYLDVDFFRYKYAGPAT